MTSSAHSLSKIHVAHVHKYGDKLVNIRVELMQESFGEESVFYPTQSVSISGDGIRALRALLNNLPAE